MSKIYGDEKVKQRAQSARPGDQVVLINWEAIKELPDQYEVLLSEVKFNLADDFSDVGNRTYMPTPQLMYKIAEAKGIHGGDKSVVEAVYEVVDLSEMTMESAPNYQKIITGYRCGKFSTIMEEDGTLRRSSMCTVDYNVWNRVSETWAEEEELSQGYANVVDGPYTYYKKQVSGPHYTATKGQYKNDYPVKYNTKWARKKHFKTEMKFAMQKAETKAHEKTIRELASITTGYKDTALSEGRFIFAKIRRSRQILQAESAARLTAMSQGIEQKQAPQEIVADLFGSPEPVLTPVADLVEQATDSASKANVINTPKWQQLLDSLDTYSSGGFVQQASMGTVTGIIGWLDTKRDNAETDPVYWDKAIGILHDIESALADSDKVKHSL